MYDLTRLLSLLPETFTTAHAARCGLTEHVLERAVRRGRVRRACPGVYRQPWTDADAERWQRLERDHLARAQVALLAHPHHALSHQTQALALGWPVRLHPDMPVHLTALYVEPRSRRVADRLLHHSDSMANEVCEAADMRMLTEARCVADCLRSSRPANGVAIADAAIRSGRVTVREVREVLDAQRRWVGRPRALAALRLVDPARETWLESYSFVTLSEWGVPFPTPQVEVYDEDGRFVGRVDGMWIADGVVGECDGRGKYLLDDDGGLTGDGRSAALRVVAEKGREDAVRSLGLDMVRWDTSEITRTPQDVAVRVNRARARGDIRRFRGRLRVNGRWLDVPTEHR